MKTSVPLKIENENELTQWFTFFYLNPKPELITQAIIVSSKCGDFDRPEILHVHQSFYGTILQLYPAQLPNVLSTISSLPEKHKQLMLKVLWMCNSIESQEALKSLGEKEQKLIGQTPPDLLAMRIMSPANIDMLWSAFHVTGKKEYVARIIQSLDLGGMTGYSARWSLGSMGYQHTRVIEICREEFSAVSATLKPLLEEVIRVAEKKLRTKSP